MYCELAELAGTGLPQSFVSRCASFKEKLQSVLDVYDFIVTHNRAVGDRQAVLVPLNIRQIPITTCRLLNESDGESTMQLYRAGEMNFLS